MAPPLLAIEALTKRFAGHAALTDVSLSVEQGEFVALLGPSGCGKTTLLRCVGGFLLPDAGTVRISGEDVTRQPPYRRPLNTVFQSYALFPHMSVAKNVAYGPRQQGASLRESAERAASALALVGLENLGKRYPRELSGGQQQRVALARAIVNRPKLLLLDEPLSALDLKLRKQVQIELKQLQEKLKIAFVFVTHDQDEAMTMADRIVVMNGGQVEQISGGREIYRSPRTRFVADFIGEANFIPLESGPNGKLVARLGGFSIERPAGLSGPVVGVLRPECVRLSPEPNARAQGAIVEDVIHRGSHASVRLDAAGLTLIARIDEGAAEALEPGQTVSASYRPEDLHIVEDRP